MPPLPMIGEGITQARVLHFSPATCCTFQPPFTGIVPETGAALFAGPSHPRTAKSEPVLVNFALLPFGALLRTNRREGRKNARLFAQHK